MKRLSVAIVIFFGWGLTAHAAAPAALTSLAAIHALTNTDAGRNIHCDFDATVTYYCWYTRELFVQDGDAAVFIYLTKDIMLTPGDRVHVRGITVPSFHPIVASDDITVLGHGAMPKSVSATYYELAHNLRDAQRVTVRAVVRTADLIYSKNVRSTYMHLLADGNEFDVSVETDDPAPLKDLLDAEVEVTGVSAAIFDSKMQQTGVKVQANTMADVKVIKYAGSSPWSLPVTSMDLILKERQVQDRTARLRIHGIITYYVPGSAVVLQDGKRSMWIETRTDHALRIGDVADATGFPDVHNGFLSLVHGEFLDSGNYAPVDPQPATWESLSSSTNIEFGHLYDLVSIEGQVMTEAREAERDEYVLNTKGRLFTAIYYHSERTSQTPLPPMKQIPIGATVRVSGICGQISSNPWNGTVPFDILLRTFDDIAVVADPPWFSIRNLSRIIILLLLAVIVVGAWGAFMMRQVHRQTRAMAIQTEAEAALERRRSHILEEINASEPLAGILEEITEMATVMLKGAPCWCETADGARFGSFASEGGKLRIIQQEISTHSGPSLGTIFAGLPLASTPRGNEPEALALAVGLATLAIESRRLYSDLLHRSEFDLLTDVHNRFALDKQVETLIEEARQDAGSFGLIYIDLDKFKQVNDLYGHRVGDGYLQMVALRMKQQLRSHDLLARVGGDEFAVLLPIVHTRAEVEEIAQRMERCFDEPFSIEGQLLSGSASIGAALYPQDGQDKDSLMNAADAAMYETKNSKRQVDRMMAVSRNLQPSPKISH